MNKMEEVIERLCQNCADLSNNLNMLVVMLREQNKDTSKLMAIRKMLSEAEPEMPQTENLVFSFDFGGSETTYEAYEDVEDENQRRQESQERQEYKEKEAAFLKRRDEVIRGKSQRRIKVPEPQKSNEDNGFYFVNSYEINVEDENQRSRDHKEKEAAYLKRRDEMIGGKSQRRTKVPVPQVQQNVDSDNNFEQDGDVVLENLRNEEADLCGRIPLSYEHFKSKKFPQNN
jgi:hypothetical protein